MIKLPLKVNTYVMSECWTFYGFSIIQTHPNYLEWLSGHMGLIMLDDYNTMYGNDSGRFGMEYYTDILQYEKIDISAFDKELIVEVIKNEINNGYYVIFDCNYNGLYEEAEINTHDIHETLIYGYDDEKQVMYTAWLWNGQFKECEFPYDKICKGYNLTLEWFREKPDEIYYRRAWFYPVTRIKLRDKLNCIDPIYKFINKLECEFAGGKWIKTYLNENGEEELITRYSGTSIIQKILDLCNNAINTDIDVYNKHSGKIAGVYVKIYEHNKMILDCIKWVYNKMDINNEYAESLYKQYSDMVESFQLLYLLCYKYRIKPKMRSLKIITKRTSECLKNNKKLLKELKNFLFDEYIRYESI